MFRGVNHITMDAKGRVALPAKQRERLLDVCGGQLVATIDLNDRCLRVYPMPAWEKLEQDLRELPSMKPAVRRIQRLLIGYASELEFDGNGRVLLPQPLREYACLEKKLVLVGQGDALELWSEEVWMPSREQWIDEVHGDAELPEELMSIAF